MKSRFNAVPWFLFLSVAASRFVGTSAIRRFPISLPPVSLIHKETSIDLKTSNATMVLSNIGPWIGDLRGGGILEDTKDTLRGVAVLTAFASAVVTPLTLYRQAYSFSVGYALSISSMGVAMLWKLLETNPVGCNASFALVSALLFYGLRLGVFLLVREAMAPSKKSQILSFETTTMLQRIPFSICVSLLYAFMALPALYVCCSSNLEATGLRWVSTGAFLAWLGNTIEAITDHQKSKAKLGKDASPKFEGPTTGWYSLSRHPNYFGEMIFWLGVLLGGAPGLAWNIPAWTLSLLGFVSIYGIMIGASARIEVKQNDRYGGQRLYDEWKKTVPELLPVPWKNGSTQAPFPAIIRFGITTVPAIAISALATKGMFWVADKWVCR